MGYDSPFTAAKINSISEIAGMTVPIQMQRGGSMSLQPPRSRFMITDNLGGSGKLRSGTDDEDRSPSPQPRDLSIPPMRHQQDDSDDDQSEQSDDHSVCSGNYPKITIKLVALRRLTIEKIFKIPIRETTNCVTIWRH
jgi:hypothetical protein